MDTDKYDWTARHTVHLQLPPTDVQRKHKHKIQKDVKHNRTQLKKYEIIRKIGI